MFKLDPDGVDWRRPVIWLPVLLMPFVILAAIDEEQYFLSAVFGTLCVGLSDPGGGYGYRASHLAVYALIGGLLTALGLAVGVEGWGWVVLAAFAVTLLAGLAVTFGMHRFVAAMLLNIWFVVVLALAPGLAHSHAASRTWAQVLAWLGGAALWIGVTFVAWLARGRKDRPPPIAEFPDDVSPRPVTRPLVMFAVLRALAIAIAVAIAFGLHLPNGSWIPIAALVAMKFSLDQTALVAEQRLAGAVIGAALASMLLVTIDNRYVLEVVIVLAFAIGVAIRFANYAYHCAAIATAVLIALDLPHPSNVSTEARRVLFTFIGVGISVVVMLLANLLAKRAPARSPRGASQPG